MLEEEGTLWTPEGDARVRLTEDDLVWWYSIARAGRFLVCGGSGGRFASLRSEPGGELMLIEIGSEPVGLAMLLCGDRYGGIYYATTSTLHSATVDSTGHIAAGEDYQADDTRALVASYGLDHVYASQDDGVVLYDVTGPGQLVRVATLLQNGWPLEDLAIGFNAEKGVDLIAATASDSLFVYEVDHAGMATLLLAEGGLDTRKNQRAVFLEPNRLYYTNGADRAWLRAGPGLQRRWEIELLQHRPVDIAIAPDGESWAELSSDGNLSYGTGMRAGFAAPGSQLAGDFGNQIAISDTHIYTGKWQDWTERLYVFDRATPPNLLDSLAVEFPPGGPVTWSLERDFLVTHWAVFDLSDPIHPDVLGTFYEPPQYDYVYDVVTRPFPGSETHVLAAIRTWASMRDSLSFYRISRVWGVEWLASDIVDFGGHNAFDDTRDILYRPEWTRSPQVIWVYDVSDPSQPRRIHRHVLDDGPFTRSITGTTCQAGILHVFDSHALHGVNKARKVTPLWFDGERLVPAGTPLHAPTSTWRPSGQAGYLPMRGATDGSILLTYDPPPLPRREECCGVDEWPPKE